MSGQPLPDRHLAPSFVRMSRPVTRRPEPECRFIEARGTPVYTRLSEHGTRETPVLALHGLGVSGRYLLPTMCELLGEHDLYVPDLPGFGRSPRAPQALSVDEHARVLEALMEQLGLERALVYGNSFGCQVAVALAVVAPHRVSRLVLSGPAIDLSARSTRAQIRRLAKSAFVEPFSLSLLAVADFLRSGPRWMIGTLKRAMEDRIELKLPQVGCPALVLHGERDALVTEAWSAKVADLLPHGRLIVLPGQPHTLNYAAPELTAQHIREFIEATDEQPVRIRPVTSAP